MRARSRYSPGAKSDPRARSRRAGGFLPRATLTRRILFINVLALAILIGGVFYLDQFRAGLLAARLDGLTIQAKMIASALGEAALVGRPEVAPSHKRIVVTVLGILLLGDLSFVHLILHTNLIPQAAAPPAGDSGLDLIFGLLRADDYSGLPNGSLVKMGGVLTGCYVAWWKYVRDKKP